MNVYLVDRLPKDRPYSWVLTVDPNKRHGGLLTAIDHQGNRFYMGEHYAEGIPDRLHAAAYLALLAAWKLTPGRDVALFSDPGGAGAQAIINLAECGVHCQPVPKDAGSVKASIESIRRAAWLDPNHKHPLTGQRPAPHCYFYTGLKSKWTKDGVEYYESRLMWELRQYRQMQKASGVAAPPDTPVKENDDLVDPMRYVELVRPFAPDYVDRSSDLEREKLDKLSKRAASEFDELVARHGKQSMQEEPAW